MGCGGSRIVETHPLTPVSDAFTRTAPEHDVDLPAQTGRKLWNKHSDHVEVSSVHQLPPLLSGNPERSPSGNQSGRQLPNVTPGGGQAAVAFNIPLLEPNGRIDGSDSDKEGAGSLVQKHPPRRFQRLEDNQLTLQMYREKHADAAQRRSQIINQRVQSARSRNLRSAGRALSRATLTSNDEPIEGGIADHQRGESDLS